MLVDEVATFVEEMRRITVLWDELWLGTLSQHVEELQKKVGAEFGFKHDLNMVLSVNIECCDYLVCWCNVVSIEWSFSII